MDWAEAGALTAVAVASYLIGSFPSAYLIGRARSGIDVRTAGEGNVGARNVFHEVGARWGILVFLLDFGKGAALAFALGGEPPSRLAVGAVFLVVGHAYPIWLGFAGGKGLAAAGGFAAALMPIAALAGAALCGAVWLATRRFLPTVVTGVISMYLVAPLTGAGWGVIGISLLGFLTTAAKRVIDEPRMRTIEAQTGWDRSTGGTR